MSDRRFKNWIIEYRRPANRTEFKTTFTDSVSIESKSVFDCSETESRKVFYTPFGRCSLGVFVHRKQRLCTLNLREKPVDCVAAQSYYWGNTLCGNRKWKIFQKNRLTDISKLYRVRDPGSKRFSYFPPNRKKAFEQLNPIPTNKRSIRGFYLSGTKCRRRGEAFRSRHTRGGIRRLWKMYNGPCMVLFIRFYINMCFP